jgi:hypothetical protein
VNLPTKIYTETELARAKKTSKVIGWIQGAGVVIGGTIVLNLLGWIPTVLVIGGVGYVGYKLLSSGSDDGDE